MSADDTTLNDYYGRAPEPSIGGEQRNYSIAEMRAILHASEDADADVDSEDEIKVDEIIILNPDVNEEM